MFKIIFTFLLVALTSTTYYSQNINLDEYEIYVGDSLIAKSDFMKFSKDLSEEKLKKLEFKPITNGVKKTFYLNGKIYSNGKIENLKENGFWEYWYSNGNKAREGNFLNGKPDRIHKYWYENGNLRGIGSWKNGVYDGKWETYNENGSEKTLQTYKDGKLVQ